jgi:pimeloyl-ACP methyl ester carboxylesterase
MVTAVTDFEPDRAGDRLIRRRVARLHGHTVTYRTAGTAGPVLVLIHGVAGSSATWDPVLPLLAERFQVVAPDLLGHGESAKPRGDYSLGAYASGVRDLLGLLRHDRVTVVGHSLGGGIAMQFAYQFPDRCQRLVLVGSGGLGREITPVLRAATIPGAEVVLPLLAHQRVRGALGAVGRHLSRLPFPVAVRPAAREVARSWASFSDTQAAAAFVHTLRSVVDLRGQRVNASDRLYLTEGVPTLLVWGGNDMFLPAKHALAAHQAMPGSRLELFEAAGHYPHQDEPLRFARVLQDFVTSTAPAQLDPELLHLRLTAKAAEQPPGDPGLPANIVEETQRHA